MAGKKVLFINQEIIPYVPETELSRMGRDLPQQIQENGFEIRTFMPKWGNINERRGQLHEVIRLSGMNLIIDETDHPLIIKVASIPVSRLQVYFIDNEDYFIRRQAMVMNTLITVSVQYFLHVAFLKPLRNYVGHQILFNAKVGCLLWFLFILRLHIAMTLLSLTRKL